MKSKLHLFSYTALAIASALYVALTFMGPVDSASNRYELSATKIHLLQLTIVIPVVIIWFVALWGSLRFKAYALSIKASPDGQALNRLSNGLLLLVGGLVASSLIQAAEDIFAQWGYMEVWTVFHNISAAALALLAFVFIFLGSQRLAGIVKKADKSKWSPMVMVTLMGMAYVWALANNPYRQDSPNPLDTPSYFLPDWAIIVALVLPYLLTWYFGFRASAFLKLYENSSPGIIYRESLKGLSRGMILIIISSVAIQLLGAVAPSLRDLGLSGLLILIYLLIILYAAGHVMVANGARKLAKIEEVGR